MSVLGDASMGSPIQEHQVAMANDLQWVVGKLETLGDPHNFINQEALYVFPVRSPLVAPWTFTGLPNSRPDHVYVSREGVQFLIFPDDETVELLRQAPHQETVILNLPLAVIRGDVPFLSEAKARNFLDFWKGVFVPVSRARIHYLAASAAELPTQAKLLYVNRAALQSYSGG
ncbi:MAG: hypothetical protein JXC32_10415 [Anaerolineae bacterium]|nr:hypothetical protein [Anaerolineae bacterium]